MYLCIAEHIRHVYSTLYRDGEGISFMTSKQTILYIFPLKFADFFCKILQV